MKRTQIPRRSNLKRVRRKGKLWHSSVREVDQKTKRAKMKAKPYHSVKTRRGLEDLADDVLSQFVRLRDERCVLCGSTYQLEAGHYIKRRFESTRWNTSNLHALCRVCNQRDNEDHSEYGRWMRTMYGAEGLAALHRLKEHGGKVSDSALEELIKVTREAIKTLKA